MKLLVAVLGLLVGTQAFAGGGGSPCRDAVVTDRNVVEVGGAFGNGQNMILVSATHSDHGCASALVITIKEKRPRGGSLESLLPFLKFAAIRVNSNGFLFPVIVPQDKVSINADGNIEIRGLLLRDKLFVNISAVGIFAFEIN